jgi:hypothetical protein
MRSALGSHPQQELSYRPGLLEGEILAFLAEDHFNLEREPRPGTTLKAPVGIVSRRGDTHGCPSRGVRK